MFVKVLILGPPGAGKSTARRTLNTSINDFISRSGKVRYITCINDYEILQEMYRLELQENHSLKRFNSTEYGGFNVLDLLVFDEALWKASEQISSLLEAREDQWVLFEFSRNNYDLAFTDLKRHNTTLLQRDVYILYIEAEKQLCRDRVHKRVEHPDLTTSDDHFVSDYIFDTYYDKESKSDIENACAKHHIDMGMVRHIINNDSQADFIRTIKQYAEEILRSHEP